MIEQEDQDLKPLMMAMVAAAKAMPSLRKGDRNPHGGYAYVSIDDYFEKAAQVAHEHGLTWTIEEVSSDTRIMGEKLGPGGKATPVYAWVVKYSFHLFHESGVGIADFFSVTILHPIQGAQTAGSAMSYAAKLFLRNAFHIVTGEQDADATDTDAFGMGATPPASPPRTAGPARVMGGASAPVAAVEGPRVARDARVQSGAPPAKDTLPASEVVAGAEPLDVSRALEVALEFLNTIASNDDLLDYWKRNEDLFKELKLCNEEAYATLTKAFKARKASFAKGA